MKVKELMKKLSKMPQEAEIEISRPVFNDDMDGEVSHDITSGPYVMERHNLSNSNASTEKIVVIEITEE